MQLTNYGPPHSFDYEKAEQVPQQCVFAVELLDSQPLFNGRKVLQLDSWNDARVFHIFNNNAANVVGIESAWHVDNFCNEINQLDDANAKLIKQGLNLWHYEGLERCSLETLGIAYSSVYDSMCKGWVKSNPEEYQDIKFKEDPEKFVLFVKKSEISEEDTLIRSLISKFGLKGQINCHSEWLKDTGGYCYNDHIYMWINREELPTIVEKFGFKV
jgi:hypothetical protein